MNDQPTGFAYGLSGRALLDAIGGPEDLQKLDYLQLEALATEVREFIVRATSVNAGHLGSNLGVVELTFAIHRVFDSPRDIILWDTGHQAYVHKIVTGRARDFDDLRQPGGLSGYPNRQESAHDWIENSHASTVLSYAHGWAEALRARGESSDRRVVAVIGDGSLTGGMAYEALNNLGATDSRVLVILNDNGRSYAPTVSKLTHAGSRSGSLHRTEVSESLVEDLPLVGESGPLRQPRVQSANPTGTTAPQAFFEALGVRYLGPFDGHSIVQLEAALRDAADFDGAVVVHVLTQKGRGYSFAEADQEKHLHDVKPFDPEVGPMPTTVRDWTSAFTEALLEVAAEDDRVHAITAAMPGPTGLLPFGARFPNRLHDVGIAEQHAVTLAAGMAMGGLRPIVAVYSTFLSRAFDQVNMDVGLHRLAVVFVVDRSGITGEDGPSHHGVLDLALFTKIPGMTVLAPSSAQELRVMLRHAMGIVDGPVLIRFARGLARQVSLEDVGDGLNARLVRNGEGLQGALTAEGKRSVCILSVGKMLESCEAAADLLAREHGIIATVWDVRCVKPLDQTMLRDASTHSLVVTVEDGVREGGAGSAIADALVRQSLVCGVASPVVVTLGTPAEFIAQGKPDAIYQALGLDANGIASTAAESLAAVLGADEGRAAKLLEVRSVMVDAR